MALCYISSRKRIQRTLAFPIGWEGFLEQQFLFFWRGRRYQITPRMSQMIYSSIIQSHIHPKEFNFQYLNTSCGIMWNIYLAFVPSSWHTDPKAFWISRVIEVSFDIPEHLSIIPEFMIRRWHWGPLDTSEWGLLPKKNKNFQPHSWASRERRRATDWIQSPMANSLINHVNIRKPP